MLKNRTIAIAISSALLTLAQVDAAPAATPLATVRATSESTASPDTGHAPGDYDRALIAQQTLEGWKREHPTEDRDRRQENRTRSGSTRAEHRD